MKIFQSSLTRSLTLDDLYAPSPLTTGVVAVRVVYLFCLPVSEGEFPHPVDASSYTRTQAHSPSAVGSVEPVSREVVRAEGKCVEWCYVGHRTVL